ncbi:MAG: hypothetical protein ABI039_07585 [Vicinamibacterales bacterium]
MNRDSRNRGGAFTVTEKVQDEVRFKASVATHSTGVDPVANPVPDAGVHATATGCCPSVADGVEKLTVVAGPVEGAVIGAGQLRPGGALIGGATTLGSAACGGAGVGAVGVWHPLATTR